MTQEKLVTISVDGQELKARPGQMLIEVTDAAGITIPRFCYHKKLSIAANCRMCLVEVVRAPKPLPACATPVTDGMQVFTKSPVAIAAQQGTMEFLLINHPLDCPICDQGGECELQELSIGYGSSHSEYSETKRVVPDRDIGPLIATEMTRCIHCTRCVRFGEEIAGVRELGATGRGERTRIGTYIAKTVDSEMSGNVIDLCPVGALTSKPFRFTARAWEMDRRHGIAAHDCVGSNIEYLTRRGEVMRVDPRDNEDLNECWLSDRDRFSYQGLAKGRLLTPRIKKAGRWQNTDWQTALEATVNGLKKAGKDLGADAVMALLSPSSTTEEAYLLQKLVRGIGSNNIDHRLRQMDFSAQDLEPSAPSLGRSLASLGQVKSALLIGSHVRKEQPIVAHRLAAAAKKGAEIHFVNGMNYAFNFPVRSQLVGNPTAIEEHLAGIAKALIDGKKAPAGVEGLDALLKGRRSSAEEKAIAASLKEAGADAAILLGQQALMHPALAHVHALAQAVSVLSGATLGVLSDGANSAGAWLAGAVPHRLAGGAAAPEAGKYTRAMFAAESSAFILLNTEPDLDGAVPGPYRRAISKSEFTVALTAYENEYLETRCDVMLPVTPYAETSGTFVNGEGVWQSFAAAVPPKGEARPAWKVLRVLGNLFSVDGFDQVSSEDVLNELKGVIEAATLTGERGWRCPVGLTPKDDEIWRIASVPAYSVDPVVRRADALQKTADGVAEATAAMCAAQSRALNVGAGDRIRLHQHDYAGEFVVEVDDRVPAGCIHVPAGAPGSDTLETAFGAVTVEKIS
ncbi:MAG: NADH-quinone oxidoreductase subunit G [Gammaproteobacteria bacterium]|nr:NADH-quinone oxidoreductase subunit G [Gammaproteobacteria bacterium]